MLWTKWSRSTGITGRDQPVRAASTRVRSKQPEGYRTFGDLMRAAAETRVIVSREQWQGFRELRNLSSHTYNEALADRLLGAIPAFADVVATLLNEIAIDASA